MNFRGGARGLTAKNSKLPYFDRIKTDPMAKINFHENPTRFVVSPTVLAINQCFGVVALNNTLAIVAALL